MSDYSAWLIEIQEGGVPHYFKMSDDGENDWTADCNDALHLSREQDAWSIIRFYGWTRARASEHLWPEPIERQVIAESNGHHWIKFQTLTCCRDCGAVRRADDQNRPCKGLVHVGPRTSEIPSHPVHTSHLEKARAKNLRKPHHR